MIREVLFGSQGWNEAKAGLDAAALRQRTIASNIANAATPGYRAQQVVFEELLASEKEGLPMARSRAGHLSGPERAVPRPSMLPRGGEADASGVNDVSVEREMTELSENTIHFQALSQFLANKYRAVRDAIRPGA